MVVWMIGEAHEGGIAAMAVGLEILCGKMRKG